MLDYTIEVIMPCHIITVTVTVLATVIATRKEGRKEAFGSTRRKKKMKKEKKSPDVIIRRHAYTISL